MVLESIRDVLRDAVRRDLRLIRIGLPHGCPAAWFGNTAADWICYTADDRLGMIAAVHAAAHLSLLHCGRIRDGGAFICTYDGMDPVLLLHEFPMLSDQDGQDLPRPLFTIEEERAADEATAALLARCDWGTNDFPPLDRAGSQGFRCVG